MGQKFQRFFLLGFLLISLSITACGNSEGDVECSLDAHCDDNNASTTDLCVDNFCQHLRISACGDADSVCPDESTCIYALDVDCPECKLSSQCDDGNASTIDICDDSVCIHTSNNSLGYSSSVFYASFESGSINADVGTEFAQQQTGGSDSNIDFFSIVDNPAPSHTNPSDKVLFISINVPGYNTRAEYHTQQMETDEKTYIYTWKEFFPSYFGEGVDNIWSSYVVGQWKTWPCEVCADHAAFICGGCGGIFNERDLSVYEEIFDFRFRAEPDCDNYNTPMEKGAWHAFALEIYWTNTSNGFYNLYQDGELIHSKSQVKTLFDYFIPGTYPGCNMRWGMGLYMSWLDADAGSLDYYLDDMAVFDEDDGVTIEDILQWQE